VGTESIKKLQKKKKEKETIRSAGCAVSRRNAERKKREFDVRKSQIRNTATRKNGRKAFTKKHFKIKVRGPIQTSAPEGCLAVPAGSVP